jgi:hypothetical protein
MELGEGPRLDAMRQRTMFYAPDPFEDIRWPRFGRRATARGASQHLNRKL